ncbi:Torsin-1B [Liparis tanakae]|uniref:Torsin-1B n=1 Tax=Liparis tanakae TaxID=230148 RepID=A0A4Z2EUR7_9TELE|nr:Torsin-1B [Liparis tanakae]
MKATRVYLLLHVLLSAGVLVHSFEPVTTTLFGFGLAAVGRTIYNYLHESCGPHWIHFNATGYVFDWTPRDLWSIPGQFFSLLVNDDTALLETSGVLHREGGPGEPELGLWGVDQADLEAKLFGQHIASRIILKAVTGFMGNDNPKKPLVLSLHGWTGTGKNFVSQMIADNIYKEGMKSSFVHMFTAELHFPHLSQIETYKNRWLLAIPDSHRFPVCDLPPSNAGGESITQTALDFWKAGRNREELELRDLESVLSLSVFNNKKSGLWHTSLIDKNLVDFFVPFLPLEYRHVAQCAMAEMKAKDLPANPAVADQVASDIVYFPKAERIFSVKGCKTIASKLDYFYT